MPSMKEIIEEDSQTIKVLSDDTRGIMIFDKQDNIEFKTDATPADVYEEVTCLSDKMGVDSDYVYDILTPVFDGSSTINDVYNGGYFLTSDLFDEFEIKKNGDKTVNENEDIEALEKEAEALKEENASLKDELQKAKDEIDAFLTREKEGLVDSIIEERKKKGIIESDSDCSEQKQEFMKLPIEALDFMLDDVKKVSVKFSKPEPKTQDAEPIGDESYEEKKAKLRKEMFGE